MAKGKLTIFQNLENAMSGNWNPETVSKPHINSYDMSNGKDILYRTTDKEDYEKAKLELQQNKYLKERWLKANVDLSVTAFSGLNNIKLMYRDADLMDAFPEIGAALDIISEESCILSEKGQIVNVFSKSDRIKSILEDLFVNRLNLQVTAPMAIRGMCKYGNQFMLLDIDNKLGVKGWRQLPVFNVERLENGITNPYGASQSLAVNSADINKTDLSTKFVWLDENNSQIPFRNWQIAHFRLLTNSLYLPYGCLVGDTRIETEYGYKEMSEIEIGDKVWTFNVEKQERELGEVTMFMPKGEKDVYRISTKHNFIEGTDDHKILTYNGECFVYKEIQDIKIGDLIVVRNGIKDENKQLLINKTPMPSSRNRGIKWFDCNVNSFPNTVDSELAEFLGYMIGDGSITYNRIITIAGGVQESFNKKYENILKKYSKSKVKRRYRDDGSLLSIVTCSRFFSEMLYRLGYKDGFDKKRIPSWVFESPTDIKKSFLRGIINADGYLFIDNRKENTSIRCDIELSNEQLVKDIKTLVQSLGYKSGQIYSRLREPHFSEKIGKIIYHRKESHLLSYYEVQNDQEKCNEIKNRLNDGFKTEKVRKIEYVGKKQTYDFTVDNENSNFFANGIVTHNCSFLNSARRSWRMLSLMEDMMLIYRLERSIERRVYKIYVGAIDDADVQAYVENIANNFKRTPIIDPLTGQVDLRKNILPVHKDTPIPLLDGRTIKISELAKEYEDGKENYVYSIQDNTHKIVPGKVVWCGKNYTAEELVKITLDDNSHMIMAKEHEIIMRDGTKKRADMIEVGESVMPLYRKVDKKSKKLFERYEKVYVPYSGKYEFTHRCIASELKKENEQYNTVHHKNFNKYDNSPSNLLWMDYNEHHKMHGELARKNWQDPLKREAHISNLSKACKGRILSEETKEKISKTLKSRYSNCELENVKELSRKRLIDYNKSEKHSVEAKNAGIKRGYRKDFEEYNNSELHKQHNEIRRIANIKKWKDTEKRKSAINNMTVKFDDFVWNEIRLNILNNTISSQNKMIEYINSNLIDYLLSINSSKKLHNYKKVTKPLVKARIVEKGFENFNQYYESIKKNHKVKSIEYVGGDDVYCMTVVGLNGEEDRHNFALTTWKSDGSLNDSGVFVSNCVDQDIFIPVRDQNAPTPIDTLSAAQNMTALDDIKFVQNKVCAALRIPKTFLNFEEPAGEGKNLALMDIRFTRTINRVQQAFLMELTKIATIHLYLLGFRDDLTNFNLTMNNPSTQAEQLEIENLQKKIAAARDAVSDPGNGIPIMSQTRALKEIMKWSDKEIKENLEEIRLEKALAAELEQTSQIIKRTGVFDIVDRMYGEPNAQYQDVQQGQQDDGMGGGMAGGGGFGGGDFGSGLDDLGAPGAETEGDIAGVEGGEPTADMGGGTPPESGTEPPMGPPNESRRNRIKNVLNESKKRYSNSNNSDFLFKKYLSKLEESKKSPVERIDVFDKSLRINEEFNDMLNLLDDKINEKAD